MHPVFNHTNAVKRSGVSECFCGAATTVSEDGGDSATLILDTVLARLAFLDEQLLCSSYNCFDCLRPLDWFHPCLVNLSFLVHSILFLCQFVVLPPEFSTVISPQVFPRPARYIGP